MEAAHFGWLAALGFVYLSIQSHRVASRLREIYLKTYELGKQLGGNNIDFFATPESVRFLRVSELLKRIDATVDAALASPPADLRATCDAKPGGGRQMTPGA